MESSQIVRVVRIPKRVTNGKLEFIQWGDGGRENGYVGCMCDPHLRGGSRGGVPQASCGRLGGSVSALPFGNARGFVCCFDTVCIKGGVLFCWGGAIRNQRMISYARLA